MSGGNAERAAKAAVVRAVAMEAQGTGRSQAQALNSARGVALELGLDAEGAREAATAALVLAVGGQAVAEGKVSADVAAAAEAAAEAAAAEAAAEDPAQDVVQPCWRMAQARVARASEAVSAFTAARGHVAGDDAVAERLAGQACVACWCP